jgi:predicted transcriptional regulator
MNDIELKILQMTTGIVSAFVSNTTIRADELSSLIQSTYDALNNTQKAPEPEVVAQEPAVSIRSSVKPDYIVCLEDGKKLKMLKRHLMTHYGMTPDQYRTKWNLPADYPMTAPNYSSTRAALAKQIGLGVKAKDTVSNASTITESGVQTQAAPLVEPTAVPTAELAVTE